MRFKLAAALAAGLLGITALTFSFFLFTEAGLRLLLRGAGSLAPGTLSIEEVKGRVAGLMLLTGVRYTDGDLQLRADELQGDINLAALLTLRMELAELGVSGVLIDLPPPEEGQAPRAEPPPIRTPLTFKLSEGIVEDLTIAPFEGQPVAVDRVSVAFSIGRKGLKVKSLNVRKEALEMEASGGIEMDKPEPIHFRYVWSFRMDGPGAFVGEGEITGGWETLTARHRLTSPFISDLTVRVHDPAGEPSARLNLNFAGLSPADVIQGWPRADLSGEVTGTGRPASFSLTASLNGRVAGTMDMAAGFSLARQGPHWQLDSGKLESVSSGTELSFSGRLDTDDKAAPLALSARWENLDWPPGQAQPLWTSREGELSVKGRLERFKAVLEARVEGKGIQPGRCSFSGSGDDKGFSMESFRIPLLGGEVLGKGSVQWFDRLVWRFTAQGSDLDPGRLREDWPGKLRFSLKGSGRHGAGGGNMIAEITRIGGRLRGNDLDGSLVLAAYGNTLSLDRFDLALGTTRVTAAGAAGGRWDLAASFSSGDVGLLAPGATGSAAGSLALTGPRGSPRIRARVNGDQLAVGTIRANQVSVEADAALEPDAPFTADIAALDVSFGERTFGAVNMSVSGTGEKHRVTLDAMHGSDGISAVLDGAAASGTWKGSLRASLLGGSLSGNGSVDLDKPRRWNAAFKAEGIDPAILRADLPGEISFQARGSGEGSPGSGRWSLGIDELRGKVVGLAVRGEALIEAFQERTTLKMLDFRLGRSSLRGSGDITPELGLDAGILVPSLKEFPVRAEGRAELSVSATGTVFAPAIMIEGSASEFSFRSASFENASLDALFGAGPDDPLRVRLRAERGLLGSGSFDAVSLSVDGTLSSHRATLLARSPVTDADISIAGKMKEQGWTGSADGRVLDGTFRIAGGARWRQPLRWETRFEASGLKPQLIEDPLPEKVSFSGRASGEHTGEGSSARLRVDTLSGSLRGAPISGRADIERTPGEFTVRTLDLEVGGGTFTLSGQVLSRWDLEWVLDVPDLSPFMADLGGSVTASGNVTGPRREPRAGVTLRAGDVAYGPVKVVDVVLDADIDPTGNSLIEAGLTRMRVGNYSVQSAAFTAEGLLKSHVASLSLLSSGGDLDARITGEVRDASWIGQITRWEIVSEKFGSWSLAENAPFLVGEILQAGPFCLESGVGGICVETRRQRDGNRGTANLRWTGLGLNLAEGVIPAGFDLEGSSEGHIDLAFFEGRTASTAEVRTSSGSVKYSTTGTKGEADLAFTFRKMEAEMILDQDGLRSRVDVQIGTEKGQERQLLEGTLKVPGMKIPAAADPGALQLEGSLKARFSDLDLIEALVPEMSGVRGVFTADLAVKGPLRQPRFSGRMAFTGGTFKLLTPGITLEGIDLRTTVGPGNEMTITGSAASGKGTVSAGGVLVLDPEQGWPVNLHLSGESFEIARTPYIHILVSPELDIDFRSRRLLVAGTVRVPEADIEPAQYTAATSPSSDVRVKGRQAAAAEPRPIKVQADVTLEMGERIVLEGFGLTGRISGSIGVTERPGEPTKAAGELQVNDGEYRAFGKTLDIERGRLVFTGGQIDNPGLDVRAVRRVGDVAAGVQVTGTLISPVLTLISEPPLEESEILSYLILGRPLNQASTEDARVLSRAATAVSLAGGLAVAKEIGQKFGIEEVRIETGEAAEESALVVGKYLSPRVYVQYGVGLFESMSIFRFGYQLSRRFLLQGESGAESGADLIFSIERK